MGTMFKIGVTGVNAGGGTKETRDVQASIKGFLRNKEKEG